MALSYRVESRLPDRVRIRSHQLHNLELPKAQVEAYFLTYDGVRDARYTPLAGTLTLRFDPERFDAGTLFDLLEGHDRASMRNLIAELGSFAPGSALPQRQFAVHSIVLATLLLRQTLPFAFYAVGAVLLGWPKLKRGAQSLSRFCWDEYLLESGALLSAVATGNPVSPLWLLWLDSLETLLFARQMKEVASASKTEPATLAQPLCAFQPAYERADRMVLPSVAFAGISYALSGHPDRGSAMLSINRYKGVRMPVLLYLSTDAPTAKRIEAQTLRSIGINERMADIALLTAFTGVLPPAVSTLIARSVRVYLNRKLSHRIRTLLSNQP